MKTIATIRDIDIGFESINTDFSNTRTAARSILIDENNLIALIFVGKDKYHKLPGGGVEGDETIIEALKRELLEEAGCYFCDAQELGITEEYLGRFGLFQTSYCFISKVKGEKGLPSFDNGEIANEFSLKWVDLKKSINILTAEKEHADYQARFINTRDLSLLKEADKIINDRINNG